MPRLLYRDEWFYEIAPTAMNEADFENLLLQNADAIRSRSLIVPYKKTVYSDGGSARPDLALISLDYREWWVIEVELVRYSLHHHVIPQIRVLRDAAYGREDAAYLAGRGRSLVQSSLIEMMRGEQPRVLVIVNKPDDDWRRELRRYDAHLMVFEIYRSQQNRHIFRIDGELPRLAYGVVSHCRLDDVIPRALIVSSPAALGSPAGRSLEILIDDQVTVWQRVDTKTHCYLMASHRVTLERGRWYALLRSEGDRLRIESIPYPLEGIR